jgi:hypothetical protein
MHAMDEIVIISIRNTAYVQPCIIPEMQYHKRGISHRRSKPRYATIWEIRLVMLGSLVSKVG